MNKISLFSSDGLVQEILRLPKRINKDAFSSGLKRLGQSGARLLQEWMLDKNSKWLSKSGLKTITLDADSTVKSVCGSQEGAAKGYNSSKKGAKSYHPLLVFVSEIKLLYHSWFRAGDAYTANGICEFLKEVKGSLPCGLKVFFRADSGFFSGTLFDLLEKYQWDYLVKVKLKGLKNLLKEQQWSQGKAKNIEICVFEYKAKKWSKSRTFKAVRIVNHESIDFFGKTEQITQYQYFCFICTKDIDPEQVYALYKERSTSETWIEQVKGHAQAGSTLTNDFWANDILWQLSVLAYNIALMARKGDKSIFRQEHRTFYEWFIKVPARIIKTARSVRLKLYQHYHLKQKWLSLSQQLL